MIAWRTVRIFSDRARRRLAAVARQGEQVVRIVETSPVDVSHIMGPVLLVGTALARGVMAVLATAMSDPEFSQQPLALQGAIATLARNAAQVRGFLGSFSTSKRLPTIESMVRRAVSFPTVNARGTLIASVLESAFNAPAILGVSFQSFWSVTSEGRESLGRLVAMDTVLLTEYDFDPLTEGLAALADVVPFVLDAATVIGKLSAASSTPQRPVVATIPITITQGMSLAALAARVLGNAEAWKRIVAFNDLRYPYIATDPSAQLGDSVGSVTLATPIASGTQALVLASGIQGLYPDERILFRSGFHTEIATIVSVVSQSSTVLLAAPLARDYSDVAPLLVYPPSYDVTGRVLSPGDTVLVPLTEVATSLGVSRVFLTPRLDLTALYGRDIAVTGAGEVLIDGRTGDLATREGGPNLVQALGNRIRTVRGSLPYHSTYGFNMEPFLGFRAAPIFPFFAAFEGRQSFLADPRVLSVDTISADLRGDQIVLDFNVTTTADQKFPGAVTVKVG